MTSIALSFRLLLEKTVDAISDYNVFWIFILTDKTTPLCSVANKYILPRYNFTNIKSKSGWPASSCHSYETGEDFILSQLLLMKTILCLMERRREEGRRTTTTKKPLVDYFA